MQPLAVYAVLAEGNGILESLFVLISDQQKCHGAVLWFCGFGLIYCCHVVVCFLSSHFLHCPQLLESTRRDHKRMQNKSEAVITSFTMMATMTMLMTMIFSFQRWPRECLRSRGSIAMM